MWPGRREDTVPKGQAHRQVHSGREGNLENRGGLRDDVIVTKKAED